VIERSHSVFPVIVCVNPSHQTISQRVLVVSCRFWTEKVLHHHPRRRHTRHTKETHHLGNFHTKRIKQKSKIHQSPAIPQILHTIIPIIHERQESIPREENRRGTTIIKTVIFSYNFLGGVLVLLVAKVPKTIRGTKTRYLLFSSQSLHSSRSNSLSPKTPFLIFFIRNVGIT